jgi:hypothetical protein
MIVSLVVIVLAVVSFTDFDGVAQSLVTVGFLSFFFVYLLRLLRVIDTPFKVGHARTDDDVSLFLLSEFAVNANAADGAVAVVQGLDPQLRYATLAEACLALRAGAVWVACNMDATLPSERGPVPGNGSLVAVLRTANRIEPQVAGKPAPALMQKAVERVGAHTPLVVGDVLYTDIQGGRAAGMATLHVLTGAGTPADLLAAPPEARPDYIGADLGALDRDPDELAPGARPGWTVADGAEGLTLSGDGDPLDALRALCAHHWAAGGGPARVAADGDGATTALRALGLTGR